LAGGFPGDAGAAVAAAAGVTLGGITGVAVAEMVSPLGSDIGIKIASLFAVRPASCDQRYAEMSLAV